MVAFLLIILAVAAIAVAEGHSLRQTSICSSKQRGKPKDLTKLRTKQSPSIVAVLTDGSSSSSSSTSSSIIRQRSNSIGNNARRNKKFTKQPVSRRAKVLSLLLPWLYFMAISINIPNMPKFVNWRLSETGSTDVTSKSAKVYGSISGMDAFFTFLSVNLIGCMSDVFGRRPFMMMSAIGLGLAYTIAANARSPTWFYIAAALDGLTSCMFSQAQSYIADLNSRDADENISVVLGRFQGIAVGMAFLFGIPLGGILGTKLSLQAPLRFSIGLCAFNALLIGLFLPESKEAGERKQINWNEANPLGALKMLRRNKRLITGAVAYLFVNIAQAGVQINWINYLQYRFKWSAAKSGTTMLAVGISVAVLPKLLLRLLGSTVNAITFVLLLHAISIITLGASSKPWHVYAATSLFAAGGCALPMLLGFLTEEVRPHEVGALQGAADTVRTISTMIGSPLLSRCFAYFISQEGGRIPRPENTFWVASIFSFISFSIFVLGQKL